MTRQHLELLGAAFAGVLILAVPLVLLVRAMRREDRRTRLTNAPLTGLVVLSVVSIGAWLWVTLTNVEISARISGPLQAFLLAIAAILIYLLWLVVPVAAVTWLVFKLPEIASRGPRVRAALTVVGIAAAIAGVYFAFLTGGSIWKFISLVRAMSSQPAGLAGPGVVIVSLFSFVFVIVLGSFTGVLLLIAAWALEPRRRWREWRTPSSKSSELPPA
jgi:Sec-independent protein secretion pathway component TatC